MSAIDLALGRESALIEPSAPSRNSIAPKELKGVVPPAAQRDAAGGAGAPGQDASLPFASTEDRKIVQTASLRLQVKEVGGSFEEVGRIATGVGGFIASSNFSFQGEDQVASMTVRVPSDRYQEVLSQLRRLGERVDSEASNASDVTEEYSDLQARLRNLEATETQMLQLLSQARNVNEILQVQDRLNSLRSEIERVKGRIALLDKLGDLATITVHLRPVVASSGGGGGSLGGEVSEAWDASIEFLGEIAGGVVTAVVFLWWLPIVAVPGYVVAQRWRRSREALTPARALD
jgi:hypothetical protein